VKDGNVELLGCCGNKEVRDLPSALAAFGEQTLHLKRPAYMCGGGVDWVERVKR